MTRREGVQTLAGENAELNPNVPEHSAPSGSYPHTVNADAMSKPFLYLGEVVEWIVCRGGTVDSFEVAKKRDDAERELFNLLDSEYPEVWGYPAPNLPRIYERLPSGIWARMNQGGWDDPTFSPIDDSECREDGGSITAGRQRWDGVRISTGLVLERWPAVTGRIDVAYQPRHLPARASKTVLRLTLAKARSFLKRKKYADLTRQEAVPLLLEIHPQSSRGMRRDVVNEAIPALQKRRRPGDLNNRSNELEECRRFSSLAT